MKVTECVTKQVVSIEPQASAKQAFAVMKSMGIRHLVVTKDGVVIGIVTDRDLRRPAVSDIFKSWHELYRINDEFQVEDIMTSPVVTIPADADVRDAAQLMIERRIGALPIVQKDGRLSGLITETDLLKALIGPKS